MFYLTQMCCGQTSILVNWHHIIDLYICRLHASPFELEYKAVGAPWISLIKIKWTNKKKPHLQTVQISINNKQCTLVCDCTLTFSTVVSFNELFCCSENGSTGGFWVHLWRRWDCLNDVELADVRTSSDAILNNSAVNLNSIFQKEKGKTEMDFFCKFYNSNSKEWIWKRKTD